MKTTGILIPDEIRLNVQQAADRGESAEMLSQRMADMGLEKIVAIRLLAEVTNMGLGVAKRLIHYGPAWSFRRTPDEIFHNSLYKSAAKTELFETIEGASNDEGALNSYVKTGTGN